MDIIKNKDENKGFRQALQTRASRGNRIYMKKIILLMFLVSVVILLNQCKKDPEFSFARTPYQGNNLKINGYYYYKYSANNVEYYEIYFFYRNGVILNTGVTTKDQLALFEQNCSNGTVYNKLKKHKVNWGIFKIDTNQIQFELYDYISAGARLSLWLSSGVIQNDSTFKIIALKRHGRSEITNVENIYHFKQFSPKPDSTNNFIE